MSEAFRVGLLNIEIKCIANSHMRTLIKLLKALERYFARESIEIRKYELS